MDEECEDNERAAGSGDTGTGMTGLSVREYRRDRTQLR